MRTTPLSRRHALTLMAAGAATLGLPTARARAADALTVRLDWSPHGTDAPFFLAVERGWFKAADLDVSIEDGNGSTTTAQLVGTGHYDIGHAALAPMAIGHAKAGIPIISMAGFIRKGDMGIVVPKNSGIAKPTDLIGKTVVYTAGSLEGPFMEPFFAANGVPRDKINLLNVDASSKFATYLSGKADAVVSTVPYVLPLVAGKRESVGILFADYGFDLPGFGLMATPATLQAKGPAVKRFASVVAGAWTYILNGHVEEGVKAIFAQRPKPPMSAAAMTAEIEGYRPLFHTAATLDAPIGVQNATDWTRTLRAMELAKAIPAGTKPADYFTNDYLDLATVQRLGATSGKG